MGVFRHGVSRPGGGLAIGDMIFDVFAATTARVFDGQAADVAELASRDHLNDFFALVASA
ncbi:fumarylacetoacetase, partial [Pseudomonas syringae pv. tagetis]